MELFLGTVGLFLFSSGLQTGLIFLQQSSSRLTRWWGAHAFSVYNVLTLIPWAAFVLAYGALQFTPHPPLPLSFPSSLAWESLGFQVIGAILIFSGTSLAIWVATLLGPARLNGLRHFAPVFKPVLKEELVVFGPFRWMKDPMYVGYFLVLLGMALWKNSIYDLAIALESLLLLNGFQARIENRGLNQR